MNQYVVMNGNYEETTRYIVKADDLQDALNKWLAWAKKKRIKAVDPIALSVDFDREIVPLP